MAGDVDVRKIQRVGSSSLVVTIPKAWAQRLGLEQGATVLLYDEGDSIRIVPAVRREAGTVHVDLRRAPGILGLSAPVCSYLSGMDRVRVSLPPGASVVEVKRRALGFMGMHIYEAGDNTIVIETLLDMERVDPDSLIKSLGSAASRLIEYLAETLRTGGDGESVDRAEFARQDLMRTLYVVLRSLFAQAPRSESRRDVVLKLMSASYVSLAIETLTTTTPLLRLARNMPPRDREILQEVLAEIGQEINLLLHIIPNPSAKRLAELITMLRQTGDKTIARIAEAESPLAGAALGKLHDAVRIITLSSYTTLCRILASIATP